MVPLSSLAALNKHPLVLEESEAFLNTWTLEITPRDKCYRRLFFSIHDVRLQIPAHMAPPISGAVSNHCFSNT